MSTPAPTPGSGASTSSDDSTDPAAVAGTVVGVIAVLTLVALVAFLRAKRKKDQEKDPTSGGRSRTVSHAEIRPTNQRSVTSADSVASPDRALNNATYEAGPCVPDMVYEVPSVVSVAGDESPVDPPMTHPPAAAFRQLSDI